MVDISGTSGYSTSTAIHQKVKIILVGDLCVGKTNLVHKYIYIYIYIYIPHIAE